MGHPRKRENLTHANYEGQCQCFSWSKTSGCENICKAERKFYEEYFNFGFIASDSDDELRPRCVICLEILVNTSMKLSKMECRCATCDMLFINTYFDPKL